MQIFLDNLIISLYHLHWRFCSKSSGAKYINMNVAAQWFNVVLFIFQYPESSRCASKVKIISNSSILDMCGSRFVSPSAVKYRRHWIRSVLDLLLKKVHSPMSDLSAKHKKQFRTHCLLYFSDVIMPMISRFNVTEKDHQCCHFPHVNLISKLLK